MFGASILGFGIWGLRFGLGFVGLGFVVTVHVFEFEV